MYNFETYDNYVFVTYNLINCQHKLQLPFLNNTSCNLFN